MGVAALVLGIIAIIFSWAPIIPVIFGLVGVILGALAVKKPNKTGIVTAGLVLAIIGLVLAAILNICCYGCTACIACTASEAASDFANTAYYY